jgi:hypothetical protein
MSFRTTSLLFAILIVMLLIFGIAVQAPRQAGEQGYLFPKIAETPNLKIGTVVIEKGRKEIRLVKTESGWRLEEPPVKATARADDTKVDQLVDQIQHARRVEEAVVTRRRAEAGLEPPQLKVTLKEEGAGREWTLEVGNQSADKLYAYVASSERPGEIMAVPVSSLENLFFKAPDEFRSRTLLDVTDTNTNTVRLSKPAGKEKKEETKLALSKTASGLWVYKVPAGYGAADFPGAPARKNPGVRGLLDALGNARVADLKDFEPLGAKPLADYGLAAGHESLRVEVERSAALFGPKKGQTVKETLLVGNQVTIKGKGKKKEKEQYYVRLEGDDSVARLDAAKLKTVFDVANDPALLRSHNLTELARNTIDVVDLQWGPDLKNKLQFRKLDPTLWKLYENGKSYKANATAVAGDSDSLLAALHGKDQVQQFYKADEDFGFAKPTAKVELYVGGLEPKAPNQAKERETGTAKGTAKKEAKEKEGPERGLKKGAVPAVTLIFGKTDKGLVYVKRQSKELGVSVVSAPAALLEKIIPPEGALAFLDTSLPSFDTAKVVKLELDRGPAGKLIVEKPAPAKEKEKKTTRKEEKTPAWKLVEPKDMPAGIGVNSAEVHRVLGTLAALHVEKWLQRVSPKDAKTLAGYGLEPPDLRAVVTVKKDDKTETFVYKFGKESGEKTKEIYAFMDKRDIVFLAQPQAVKVLRDAELRDTKVFQFDAARVKELDLKGWQEKVNFVLELKLERKSAGIWTALKPEGFDPNGRKVGDFVSDLSHLKAEKFVAFKVKSLAEYKLAPADPNLRIEVKMDDGKTTYVLTIGAENKEKTGYYATASTLPGVVFLASRETFGPVVASHNYFSRTAKQASAK